MPALQIDAKYDGGLVTLDQPCSNEFSIFASTPNGVTVSPNPIVV